MKKLLFVALFALVAGAGVAIVVAQNQKLDPNSLLAQNIEALGVEEAPDSDCEAGCRKARKYVCPVLYSDGTWKYCDKQRAK